MLLQVLLAACATAVVTEALPDFAGGCPIHNWCAMDMITADMYPNEWCMDGVGVLENDDKTFDSHKWGKRESYGYFTGVNGFMAQCAGKCAVLSGCVATERVQAFST